MGQWLGNFCRLSLQISSLECLIFFFSSFLSLSNFPSTLKDSLIPLLFPRGHLGIKGSFYVLWHWERGIWAMILLHSPSLMSSTPLLVFGTSLCLLQGGLAAWSITYPELVSTKVWMVPLCFFFFFEVSSLDLFPHHF